jgi:uncharacterized protein (DUF3084 family)
LSLKEKDELIQGKDELIQEKQEHLRDRKTQVTALEEKLRDNFKRLELQETVIGQLTNRANSTDAERKEFIRKLVDAQRTSSELKNKQAEIDRLTNRNQEYERAKQLLEAQGLSGGINQLVDQCLQSVNSSDQLEGELAWTAKQLERCAGNGLDHPPCWPDKQGRPEYMYRVTIYEDKLRIDGIWPGHRHDELVMIPGAETLADRTVTLDDFARLASPIKKWSVQHECRHYVRIYAGEDFPLKAFIRNMLIVEDPFYKWLSPGLI